MAWHKFRAGQKIPVDEVVDVCEKHIRSGKVGNPKEKLKRLELIRNCDHQFIVYSPTGSTWDNSPMNQNCWRTLDGEPICEPQVVSKT